MKMFAQTNAAISKLKTSPLFYLFLSSRELFHTNFWYWLSQLNSSETLKLFSKTTCPDNNLFFKREHNQSYQAEKSKVDLLVSSGMSPLVVIENKVKDFPTTLQLNRIKNSFQYAPVEFVLTTLFYTPEINFDGWNIRTYRDISEAICPAAFTDNGYHRNLIQDYKEFCLHLSELAESLPLTESYDFTITLNKELFRTLNEIKLWEGYQKLRASHLLHHFNNRNDIETGYSINNQKATIDFHFPLKDDYELIISLEDIQFRKHVAGRNPEAFAHKLLSKQIFFSNQFQGRGNKPFLKYDNPGEKKYRYQYEKITAAIPFDELFEKVCLEIDNVRTLKSEIEACLPRG